MRVLLTGGNGMVGRNVIECSCAADHQVIAPTSSDLDLRNYEAVFHYFQKCKPDVVIHAAGHVGGIQANIKEPTVFLLDNLDMGRNVVDAARRAGIKRLLNLGSSCMYPRQASNPIPEESVLTGELEPTNEGYALAKIIVARLCQYIASENKGFQYKTLIPCNLYGRHDKFDPRHSHMVAAVIHKLHQAQLQRLNTVEIWGDGNARREFMYAGDLAHCIWRALDNFDGLPPMMNVGVGQDHTVNEYYQVVAEIVGYRGRFVHDLTKPVGMMRKLVDVQRAVQWGWRAKTTLAEGLRLTYQNYLQEHCK